MKRIQMGISPHVIFLFSVFAGFFHYQALSQATQEQNNSSADSIRHRGHHTYADSSQGKNWSVGLEFSNLGASIPALDYNFPNRGLIDPYLTSDKRSNYTFGIGLKRTLCHSFSLRFSGGFSSYTVKTVSDSRSGSTPTSSYTIGNGKMEQQIYYAEAGIAATLVHRRRTAIHGGLDLLVLSRKGRRSEMTAISYSASGASQINSIQTTTGEDAFSIGLKPYIGFDFKVCPWLSLGMDIANPFLFSHVYGDRVYVNNTTGMSSQTATSPTDYRSLAFANPSLLLSLNFRF
jgi:hypothetical protein